MTEWEAYFRVEPPPDQRVDHLLAQLNANFVNANSKRRVKPAAFLPWIKQASKRTGQDILSAFKAIGAKEKDGDDR